MKNPIQLASLLSLALLLVFTSCTNDSSSPETADATETTQTVKAANTAAMPVIMKDTISLDTFNTWVANWKKLGRSWMDSTVITAYNMPLVDLREVYKETGAVSSRFYLGLKAQQKGGYEAKLMVVGVDSSNHDMTTHIFDVSKPCPTHCNSEQ